MSSVNETLTGYRSWFNHRDFSKIDPETGQALILGKGKRIKKRPPRIYQSKSGTKYIRPGKHKVRVTDVNLIINNYTGKTKRKPTRANLNSNQSVYKKNMDDRRNLLSVENAILRLNKENREQEERALTNLRVKQIKEEALANSEVILKALKKTHEDELKTEQLKFQTVSDEATDKLKNMEKQYDDLITQIMKEKPKGPTASEIGRLGGLKTAVLRRNRAGPILAPIRIEEVNEAGDFATYGDEKKDTPALGVAPGFPTQTQINPIVGTGYKKSTGLTDEQIDDMMSDEPCYLKTICSDEISSLKHLAEMALDNYGQCGFIMNLDARGHPHFEHWVAVYIDVDKENVCFYYDPFGLPPTLEISQNLSKLIESLDIPNYLSAEYNNRVNQNEKSSRCGVHCMLVLTDLFNGMSTESATDHNEKAAEAFEYFI